MNDTGRFTSASPRSAFQSFVSNTAFASVTVMDLGAQLHFITQHSKSEQLKSDLICIAAWVLLPSLRSQLFFCYFAILMSLQSAAHTPAHLPLKCILVNISSSRLGFFCCPCRSRSLRPAPESAEICSLVSELGTMTSLMHTKVILGKKGEGP